MGRSARLADPARNAARLADLLSLLDRRRGNGLLARTPGGVYLPRSVAAGEGMVVANGDGVAGDPTLGLGVSGLSAISTLALADVFAAYDDDAGDHKKVTPQKLFDALNLLTADATPDGANDYVLSYDAGVGAKKVLMDNLPGGGGGGITLISSVGVSASSTLDFESGFSNDYKWYLIIGDVKLASAATFQARIAKTGAPTTYISGASDYRWANHRSDSAAHNGGSSDTADHMFHLDSTGTLGLGFMAFLCRDGGSGNDDFRGLLQAVAHVNASYVGSFRSSTGSFVGATSGADLVVSLRFMVTSGSMTGSASLYGLA